MRSNLGRSLKSAAFLPLAVADLESYHYTEPPPSPSSVVESAQMLQLVVLGFDLTMGKVKSKGAKFAAVKKIISKKTIKKYKEEVLDPRKKDAEAEKLGRNVLQVSSALFFSYNMALGPPYRVIVDTNFINFSIQNKLDLDKGMMDCLYAKCTPCITDFVMAEHEKLGQKYRVALSVSLGYGSYLLMEFVNSFVRRRTVDIEAAMRNAKIDYEIRIHQLEHKLDLASSYLAALTSRIEVSAAEARSSASLIKARETSITRMRLVMIGCLLVWFFSVGMKEPMAG